MDLPTGIGATSPEDHFRIAAWQRPWRRQAVFVSPEGTGFAQRATIRQAAHVGVLAEALPPGAVGRMDHANAISVALYGGAPASVSRAQLLNGSNVAAICSATGTWEIVQFETADEIQPDVWRLAGLLRGQLGTEDATAAGAEVGARFVVLDDAVRPAGLLTSEIGLELNWRVAPVGSDFSADSVASHTGIGGQRALMPLAPVHLRAKPGVNGVSLNWIRRGRLDADNWSAAEIPLGEEREEYQVQIAGTGGAVVRTATTATPSFLYDGAAIEADFGSMPGEIEVTIRQLSLAAGWGVPATIRISLT
jgi:hypothetical protein